MRGRRVFTTCFLLLSVGLLYGAEDPVPDSLRELARLKQDSNPARLEALQKILQERGIPFELQTFESRPSPHGRTKGTNLLLTFGTGLREITLGAHYDALELAGGGLIDGMVDNGASAIILVRVADALKGRTLRHRVRIVFFDMEETGLLGSQAYVAEHKSDIVAAMNLDVAGFGDTLGYGFGKAQGVAQIQKALLMACAEQILMCMGSENFPPGDDRSFQNANIPVISVGFAPRLAALQAGLFLSGGENSGLEKGFVPQIFKIIHTPEDNLSKIEPATLNLGFQVVLNTVLKMDAALE
jgi:Zn-dependent M28 family amino/carboxypeptidase